MTFIVFFIFFYYFYSILCSNCVSVSVFVCLSVCCRCTVLYTVSTVRLSGKVILADEE